MHLRKLWKYKDTQIDNNFLKLCGNNKVLAVLLKNRKIDTEKKIIDFLNPMKAHLSSPDVFQDTDKIITRIKTAVENKEQITVYGDFDTDGITAASLLYLTLKEIGAQVGYYLPDRDTESHGLNTKALVQIISKRKSKLIITVDCGISNNSEVNFAKGFKTDVIITDHHEAPEILPEAFAIMNPKAPNSLKPDLELDELESLNYLAGVGVAFKLACKILEEYNKKDFVNEILPLAAIGTIGDVVELTGENRTITAMGLELIKAGKHKGIQKLLESMEINDIHTITSETVAFGIVPRLNAAGRLDSPYTAFSLLVSDNDEEIQKSINTLNDLNRLRQNLCDETFQQAKELYEKEINKYPKSIILYNENWHIGVIGIVCSKLVEEFNRPAFLMTSDSHCEDIIRCSSRSIKEINIHNVLSEHKELFEGFGGHKMAAGFSFNKNKISFEKFKNLLNQSIEENLQETDLSSTTVEADMIVEPEDIDFKTVELINKLEPFGNANPFPSFIMQELILNQYKLMGQNNNHLKLFASKNNFSNIECVKWNFPDFNIPVNTKFDIMFYPKINEFNGNKTIQYIINDMNFDYKIPQTDVKILDHRNKKNIINQVLDFINSTKKTTAIYIENANLIKKLNIPETIQNKIFNLENIPKNIEQLMFFDCPYNQNDFYKIIQKTNAKLIHLMNFEISPIKTESFITTLSGMMKYAVTNLKGEFDILRVSKALNVDTDTVDCALSLFEDCSMIEINRTENNICFISGINPTELNKIKQDDLFIELEEHINNINSFRNIYLNDSTDDIKKLLCTEIP